MAEKRVKPRSANAGQKSGEEHESLLLEAARLLPGIFLEEVMPADSIRQRTIEHIKNLGWPEKVEQLIAEGAIKSAADKALWRKSILDPPGVNLPPARVSFGHSLFVAANSSRARPNEEKRLGMVDLRVDWQQPADGRLQCALSDITENSVKKNGGDLYWLRVAPMCMFAAAFPSDVPLGKVMACIEELDDWIRLDAEHRFASAAPLLVITNREVVFNAMSTTHDALLIEEENYVSDLACVRDMAQSFNPNRDAKF